MKMRHDLREPDWDDRFKPFVDELDRDAIAILTSIDHFAHTMRSHFENQVLVHYRLSWTAFAILYELFVHGKLEVRDLAGKVGISKATVSNVSKTLEKNGYCGRESDKKDRRMTRLLLTKSGEETVATLYPKFHAEERRLVRYLDTGEKKTLLRLLNKMNNKGESESNETDV
ncbi:MarR family transcriptional regulator [Exiguobacterium sp. SL-10]|nr:MarR family transcriptional regulator [Exiguobacterium sp. SL-10]